MDSDLDINFNEVKKIPSTLTTHHIDEKQYRILKDTITANLRKDYDKYSEKVSSISVDDLKKYLDLSSSCGLSEPSNTSIVLFFIGVGTIVCKIRNNNPPISLVPKQTISSSDSETSEIEYIQNNNTIPEKSFLKRILGLFY
tara:strand:- start:1367 stop:1792 length:426 start_codon:yes stop_codon:yes gene_type:complete